MFDEAPVRRARCPPEMDVNGHQRPFCDLVSVMTVIVGGHCSALSIKLHVFPHPSLHLLQHHA
jgi:hypothetical protein